MSVIATTVATAALMSAVAHGGHTANFGMAISPASVTGPSSSVAQFTVTDVGKSAITVRTQVIELRPIAGHPGSFAPEGEYDQARISAERFTLQPGQYKRVQVIIKANDSYRHDLGVSATGSISAVKNGASVQTAAIARFTVNPSGQLQPDQSKPIVAENHTQSHTSPIVPIGALAVLSALLLSLGVWLRRRMRRHA